MQTQRPEAIPSLGHGKARSVVEWVWGQPFPKAFGATKRVGLPQL